MNDPILEAVAEQCHKQWSGWTYHLLGKMTWANSSFQLPEVWAVRWRRQINTDYTDLTETEKEADRREARKILAALLAIPHAVSAKLDEALKWADATEESVVGDNIHTLAEAYRMSQLNVVQLSGMNADYAARERESLARAEEAEAKLALLQTPPEDPKLAETWKTVDEMAQFTIKHPTCQTSTTRAIAALAAALKIETVKRQEAERKVMIARQAAEGLQPAKDIYYIGLFQEQMKLRKAAEAELTDIKEAYAATIAEACNPPAKDDRVHCTCIPALRAEIVRLKELVTAAAHVFMSPGIGEIGKNPRLGDWNWPSLAKKFEKEIPA